MTTDYKCCDCNQPGDLRPYGPNASMICFPCMSTNPAREEEAERQFIAQLNASGQFAVLDGTNTGPYPAEHNPDLAAVLKLAQEALNHLNGRD